MNTPLSILFVDSRVQDRATLLAGLANDVEVHVLDPDKDGLSQIAATLSGRSDIGSIQLLSHGAQGMVQLGSLNLTSANVQSHANDLATIGKALTADGDILLYGCDAGAGSAGHALVQSLAQLTGADVAASSDLTGAASQGGNWTLEVQTGQIEALLPFNVQALAEYSGVLATGTALEATATGTYDSMQGIAKLTSGGHADVYLHQTEGDNSFYGPPPHYVTKVVVADSSNNIIKTLQVSDAAAFVGNAAITKLTNGGFVVAWSVDNATDHTNPGPYSSFYQLYDNSGNAQGSVQSIDTTAKSVSLTALADGGFAAAYSTTYSAIGLSVYGYTNGTLGLTHKTSVGGSDNSSPLYDNSTDTHSRIYSISENNGGTPSVIQLADGSIVVTESVYVYDVTQNYTPLGDYAFKFTSGGVPTSFASGESNQRLNWSITAATEAGQHTIALSGGGFAVVSLNYKNNSQQFELMVFNSDGSPVNPNQTLTQTISQPVPKGEAPGATTEVKTYNAELITGNSANTLILYGSARFSLTESSDGKLLIVLPKNDNTGLDVYTYSQAGVLLGSPVDSGLSVTPGTSIEHPFIVADANGGFKIAYDELTRDSDSLSTSTPYSYGVFVTGPAAPNLLSLSSLSDTGTLGDGITSIKTPVIEGSGIVGATVTLYDTDGLTVLGTNTVDASGKWSITSQSLSEGAHSLTAKQVSGPDTSAASTVLALTIDSLAPAIPAKPALAPASDSGALTSDGITNVVTPTLTGLAEANSSVVLYDTDGTTVLGSGVAGSNGLYSITTSALSSGTHTITAKATDAAGNVSTVSPGLGIAIDQDAPTGFALSSSTASVSSATSGATVATLLSADAHQVTYSLAVGSGLNDADNAKFSVVGTDLQAPEGLAAGTYSLYLQATDVAGNATYQAFTFTVVNAPTVTSIERAAGATPGADHAATSLTFVVTFSEAVSGVDASDFTLTKSDTANATIGAVTSIDGISYSVEVSNPVGDGTLRLDLNASGTGIVSATSVAVIGGYNGGQTYTLDHTQPLAPTLSLSPASDTGVSNTDGITRITTPVFSGIAEINSTVKLYDSNGTTLLGTAMTDGFGQWSITSTALSNGIHTLSVRATDAAGNTSVASVGKVITIDTTPPSAPSISGLAPASDSGVPGDGITRITTPVITGTAEPGSAVTLYDTDGTTVLGSGVANGSGLWTITSSTLGNGPHTLTAKAIDAAGNMSAASAATSITIDLIAPEAPNGLALAAASDSGTLGDGITNVSRPVITGNAEPNSWVMLYDTNGITLLGTAIANNLGAWSVTSDTLAPGSHTLTVKQADVAGNVSIASDPLTLSIIEAPVTPTTPSTPTVVDGVPVTSTPVVLPDGGAGTTVTVPVVSSNAGTTVGNPNVADIPLVTTNGAALLTTKVPVGTALKATGGASLSAGNSLETLIAAIKAQTTTHDVSDQNHLTGNGTDFLSLLSPDVPLLVNTVVVQNTSASSSIPLTLTGTSTASQHTALVVDTTGLASNSSIVLEKVDFAAMIGAVTVTGNTSGQILTGDAASQTFVLDTAAPSQVYAGAGNDQLHYGVGTSAVVSGTPLASNFTLTHENSLTKASAVYLNGGTGSDVAAFTKSQSDYSIEQHDGYVLVTDKADPTQQITVTNTESIRFSDGVVGVQSRDELTTIAGLYKTVLGRQADIGGFDYWGASQAQGASLGTLTVNILANTESIARGFGLNGDASHDIDVLYKAVFGRASDAEGKAYWIAELANGRGIADIATGFVTSVEMTGHKLATTDWDLYF